MVADELSPLLKIVIALAFLAGIAFFLVVHIIGIYNGQVEQGGALLLQVIP